MLVLNLLLLQKIAFMVALGLVTTEQLEGKKVAVVVVGLVAAAAVLVQTRSLFASEIQTKRQERKRRSTANPAYSGLFEPEVRKASVSVQRKLTNRVLTRLISLSLQRKRSASHYLNSSLFLTAQGKTVD